jgi:hypothetical protein
MFINKEHGDVVGNDEKYKRIWNGIRSWLFVEMRKGVMNQSNVHMLVMCQGFVTKAS